MMEQFNLKITEATKMMIVLRASQWGCTQSDFVRWCIEEGLDRKDKPVPIAITKSLAEY